MINKIIGKNTNARAHQKIIFYFQKNYGDVLTLNFKHSQNNLSVNCIQLYKSKMKSFFIYAEKKKNAI